MRNIAIVSFIMVPAFSTPISNLTNILSTENHVFLCLGADGQMDFSRLNPTIRRYILNHKTGNNKIIQFFRCSTLQIKIILKLIASRRETEDIIFFMEYPAIFPMVIAKILNIKTYWLIPSKISLFSQSHFKKGAISSKKCLELCDKIVLYSDSLVSFWHLEKYRNKIAIGPHHFLDFKQFTITTRFVDRPLSMGYIGRLSEEKGILNFVEAIPEIIAANPNYQVVVGGDGELRELIEDCISDNSILSRIYCPGWIRHNDLSRHLNNLRLLIIPSYTEGLPNIMLEAMACGTPVLATPVGAIPDVIIDGKTGFLMKDNSPKCIAENVKRALNSPDLQQIAENGRRYVNDNFTFEKAISGWKRILDY